MITEVFSVLPEGFKADEAGDWSAVIHWKIDGGPDQTLVIGDGACAASEGLEGEPTCTITVDADTLLEMLRGDLDPNEAFMTGRAMADNMNDLMLLGMAFDFEAVTGQVQEILASGDEGGEAEEGGGGSLVERFFALMPEGFKPGAAPDWDAVIHWKVAGGTDQTVVVEGGEETRVESGLAGDPSCTIEVERDVLVQMIRGELDPNEAFMTGQAMADNMMDLMNMAAAFDLMEVIEALRAERE